MSFAVSDHRGAGTDGRRPRGIRGGTSRRARIRLGAGARYVGRARCGSRPGPGSLSRRQHERRRPGPGRPRGRSAQPGRRGPAPAAHAGRDGRLRQQAPWPRSRSGSTCSGSRQARRIRWISCSPAGPGRSGSARSPPPASARPTALWTAASLARCRPAAACWSGWAPAAAASPGSRSPSPGGCGSQATAGTGSSRSKSAARGVSYGTPRGRATISYNARHRTLTVTVRASGITPGPHAAHIHLGSCQRQGPVKYMLRDLVANRHGRIVRAVRVFTNVTRPIPARGWYLNIHQGNSGNILSNGQPTIFFRPLICANIRGTRANIRVPARTSAVPARTSAVPARSPQF